MAGKAREVTGRSGATDTFLILTAFRGFMLLLGWGGTAGIIGTLSAALVSATLLFSPLRSYHVTKTAARTDQSCYKRVLDEALSQLILG